MASRVEGPPLWKRLAAMVGLILIQATLVLGIAWLVKEFALTPLAEWLPVRVGITTPIRHVATVLVLLSLYWMIAGKLARRTVPELDVRRVLADGGGGIVVGMVLMASVLAPLWALGYLHFDGVGSVRALPGMFAGILLAASWEEVIFRGVLYRNLEGQLGTLAAMGTSAALFGYVHIINPNADMVAVVSATMGGLLMCCAYSLSGRLWAPIGVHAGWNVLQVLAGVPLSGGGDDFGVFVTSRLDGPTILTGGEFGPESSVLAIGVVTLAFLAGLGWMYRRELLVPPSWRIADAETAVGP